MVKVIKQPRWSFWRFRQIYQCDVPRGCANPLELAVAYYQKRGLRNLVREPYAIRFQRGSLAASFFRFIEITQQQEVEIRWDSAQRTLTCDFDVFYPYPSVNVAPWHLQREVGGLDAWLEQSANQGTAPAELAPQKNGAPERHVAFRAPSNFIYRLIYPVYRIFSWWRYWTVRRFTRAGLALLIALIVTAISGLDTESSVGYQAFTLLLGMLTVAMIFAIGFRARFSAERYLPRFGTAGQPFIYRVAVQNLTTKPQAGLTLIESMADPRPSFAEWKAVQLDHDKHTRSFSFNRPRRSNPFRLATVRESLLPLVAPGEKAEVPVELTPLRRGIVRFAGVCLARPDPIGIFRAFRRIPLPQNVLILPKRYWLPPLALPGELRYQPGGVAMASNIGRSDEFMSLREYRRGDPLRQIHWRSWAKAGKPIVKEVEDEFFVRHALILDTFTDRPHSDEFEEAVSVAASFACTVLTQESLLDLLFVGSQAYCFTAGRGLAQADQMVEILASVQPSNEPFAALDKAVIEHTSAVSGCICVLLAWDEPRQQLVRKLKALGLPVLVLVILPSGKTGPLEPGPMRDDPARFHALEMGRIEEQLAVMA